MVIQNQVHVLYLSAMNEQSGTALDTGRTPLRIYELCQDKRGLEQVEDEGSDVEGGFQVRVQTEYSEIQWNLHRDFEQEPEDGRISWD